MKDGVFLLPTSFAQQRLWFLDQLVPGNAFYNVDSAIPMIMGPDDVPVLERSLNELVRRHESLRTTFQAVDGEPWQVIAPSLQLPLPVVDLRHLPAAQRQAEALRLATEEARQPFDLAAGPLVRATLLRMAEEAYVFLLTMHHIVADGWSMGVFWKELTAVWEAFEQGQPSPLPELPIQYADFAVWQRQWLQGEVLENHLAYWRQQLHDLPLLNLPTDRPRPAVQTFRGAKQPVTLSRSLTAALKALSRSEGATLFMTLLAAFQLLLYRYAGQDDIAVGTYIAGRNRAELEGLIGFFINTLVMRTNLSGDPSFRQLLSRVREVALGAYTHQDMPFAKLVQELQPERDLSRNPMFQVLFHLFNTPNWDFEDSEENSAPFEVIHEPAIFDLVLTLMETSDGLSGAFEYNVDLFDSGTIARMSGHFQTLLEAIVAQPDQCITDLPLLEETERRQIVQDWNATYKPDSYDTDLITAFENRVKQTPDAVAFTCGPEELSYADLAQKAAQLAHHLRDHGVDRGTPVGVLMERGIDPVVALLAIWEAGGVYVPLDPSYPRERLAFMLEEAGVTFLVVNRWPIPLLVESKITVVRIDEHLSKVSHEDATDLPVRAMPDALAYIIFTSGSTGKPRGVAVQHKQIINRLAWMWETYPFVFDEVCCQKTALSFVDSFWELLGPLLQGVKTVVIPDSVFRDPEALVRNLAEYRVTRIWVVPSFLGLMLDTFPELQQRLPALKFWVTTGENLPIGLFNRFRKTMPQSTLYNLYGTSEVWDATWYDPKAERSDKDVLYNIPIGRPIRNVQTYVLDRKMQPVPIGVHGELYVGGVGLAQGYINQPELTRQKFVPNPFSNEPSDRLSKTGDLARYRPDGNIEYLGRLDHQVKIRGFRVELEEIEAVLSQHPSVRQAKVVTKEDRLGQPHLVAYVVPEVEYQHEAAHTSSRQTIWDAELIPQWREVWDEAYRQERVEQGTFNVSGFNSSYTGLPIPIDEVTEWVNQAVERVLSLRPSSVLEIGCGAGLLLFRIAPHCKFYQGNDFSPLALSFIEEQLAKLDLPQVQVSQRVAHDLSDIEAETFDTVIINSVVQYFPSIEYLYCMLTRLCEIVKIGGSIFLGDVRSLPLLEAFHASVELYRSPDSLPLPVLRQRVQKRMMMEEELAIDPTFFFTIKHSLPQISYIQVRPKRGTYHNEFTRFRYDVLLQIGGEKPDLIPREGLDWDRDQLNLSKLKHILRTQEPSTLVASRVPNKRLSLEMEALDWLRDGSGSMTVADLRHLLRNTAENGIDPEEIWTLGGMVPYTVELYWSGPGADGCYDVLFQRQEESEERASASVTGLPEPHRSPPKPWSHYANNPMQVIFTRKLVPELSRFLESRLPKYMIPSSYLVLEQLPLTPSGKLDRRMLPAPDQIRASLASTYVAPRTPTEEALAQMFSDVLGANQVSIHDNFFSELGGHSLLATQLVSRVRDTFRVELPLRVIFEAPTVAELALTVEQARIASTPLEQVEIQPISRQRLLGEHT